MDTLFSNVPLRATFTLTNRIRLPIMADVKQSSGIFHQTGDWQICGPIFRNPFEEQEEAVLASDFASMSHMIFEEQDPSPTESSTSSLFSPSQSLQSTETSTPAESLYSNEDEKSDTINISPELSSHTSPSSPSPRNSVWNQRRESLTEAYHGQITPKMSAATILGDTYKIDRGAPIFMQVQGDNIKYEEVSKDQMPQLSLLKSELRQVMTPIETPPETQEEEEMSVKVLQSTPHLVIRGKILLESRKAVWRKHSKLQEVDLEAQVRSLPDLFPVDPWELPIDAGMDLGANKSGKKTFEFPQYRVDAMCAKCTKGLIDCTRCDGLAAVDCFWCASTGFFKGSQCKKCKTTGRIHCVKCSNRAKIDCPSCDGKGAIKWALCIDVKVNLVILPPITLQDLIVSQEEEAMLLGKPDLIKLKATQAIYQIALQLLENSVAECQEKPGRKEKIPISAECHVERHMKRLLHVSRWNNLHPEEVETAQYLHSTDQEASSQSSLTMTDADESENTSEGSRRSSLQSTHSLWKPHSRRPSLPLPSNITSLTNLDKVSSFFKRRTSLA